MPLVKRRLGTPSSWAMQKQPLAAVEQHQSKATDKGAKGGKKGQKRHLRCITIVASDDSDSEKAGNSDEEYVTIIERDIKHQAQQSKDHFKKLIEATCPDHSYPIKHKLKDCTMMKKFMTSWAFSKGRKPKADPGRKGATPIPGEAEVMTIFG
jgi:hypothetical protein